MLSLIRRSLVVAVIGSLFLGGAAFGAVVFTASTGLTIQVNPASIHKGQLVSIHGTLHSSKTFCRVSSKVLLKRGSTTVGSSTTDSQGRYFFSKHPSHTVTYHTVFNGKVDAVHPNHRVCTSSTSANRTVTVST